MKKILTALFMLFVMSMPISAAETELVKDMVSFDRAYIPSLAMTSQKKAEPSKKALKILATEWETFKGKYYASHPSDKDWTSDMDSIEEGILEASNIVENGGSLSEAHEAVESIRFTMLEMRQRDNIDYFVDHLTRFHDPMEMILVVVAGKTPETISEKDLERIRSKLPEAVKLWEHVAAFKIDQSLYGFGEDKMKKIRAAVEAETKALGTLGEVFETGNKSDIITAASDIKPNFAKVFMQFGDFGRLKKQ